MRTFIRKWVRYGLALAVLASVLAPGRIRAFTIRSGRGVDDEAEVAAATARILEMPHEVEALATARSTAWAFESLGAMDQPSADGTNTYLVSRASRENGMIAALAGTGADETHGGYGQFRTIPRWRHLLLCGVAGRMGASVLALLGREVEAERLRLMMDCAPSTRAMLEEKRRYFTPSWIVDHGPAWLGEDGRRSPRVADAFPDPRDEIVLGELGGYLRNTLLRETQIGLVKMKETRHGDAGPLGGASGRGAPAGSGSIACAVIAVSSGPGSRTGCRR